MANTLENNFFVTESKDSETVLKEALDPDMKVDEKDEKPAISAQDGKKKKNKNRK